MKIDLEDTNTCPRIHSSFLNRISFSWCSSLVWTGFWKPLSMQNLWENPSYISSRKIVTDFEEQIQSKTLSPERRVDAKNKKYLNQQPEEAASVNSALFKLFGGKLAFWGLVKSCSDLSQIASPLIMRELMGLVTQDLSNPSTRWKGFLYGSLLLVLGVMNSVLMTQYYEKMMVMGLQVKASLISPLYKKSVRISSSAKQ